jgi:cytochrome oxidase assembly protein ShyY1
VTRYLVSQDSAADTTPARLAPPALDDGPHLSYAIQWFSFAVIAIVGAGIVAYRARTAGSTAAERD